MNSEKFSNSIIENQEWAQDLMKYLLSQTEQYVLSWSKVVIELGVKDGYIEEWISIFKNQINECYEDLVQDVTNMKSKVIDEISGLLSKNQKYADELGLKMNVQDISPNERLYQVRSELMERTEKLEKMVEKRQKDITRLMDKQKELCLLLEKTPYELSISPLPRKEEIENVQSYVDSLEQEKFNREERYLTLKDAIGKLSEELEFVPRTDFERDILSETRRNVDISESNMKQLQKCHDDMVQQLENRREEIDQLRERIDYLWGILNESISKRNLLEQYNEYNSATLAALREEVKRLEDMKKANIKVFVESLRQELQELWKNCYHLNEASQSNYQWLNSDLYTEDLLSYHELEVRKWRNFFKRNENLIKLFKEHQELWNNLLDMENQDVAGPNRYKNRGGQLLREEKIRNKLSKKIPLLEQKIKEEAINYEDYTGTPFLIFETPLLDYIENLHKERDEQRKVKLSARKQIREHTVLTPGKSCLSLFPSTSKMCLTPQTSSIKRKLTKPLTTGKKLKMEVASNSKPAKCLNSLDSNKIGGARRLSKERTKRLKMCRELFNKLHKDDLNDTNATNYDAFEKNISRRVDNCRSTLNPEDIQTSSEAIPRIEVTPASPQADAQKTTPKQRKLDRQISKLSRTPSNLKLIF